MSGQRSPTRDQQLVIQLLCGHIVRNKHQVPHTVYLKDGSPEEQEARRALARILRTSLPLDLGLRFLIADLIDPDRDEIDRRIRFGHRRKGKPSNALAEKEIAEFIWSQVRSGVKTEEAVFQAAERFGLERTRIFEIWSHWQPILKRLNRRQT
jgi:hypothetical protein